MNAKVETANVFAAGGHKRASASEFFTLVSTWYERSKSRRELAGLSDHMLKDIGVSRVDAWAESRKPFWKA